MDSQLFSQVPSQEASSTLGSRTSHMNILFLCTAHNSLSQQLYLRLCKAHTVTIEYALSDKVMIEAANLVRPDLIICPFLTSPVPSEVFDNYLTLIVHPGPPGDAGPSALDWVLMGDDGTVPDSAELLKSQPWNETGRSHWGVTVLQAVAEMDAGPVWAFEQFEIDINDPKTTKATLYRGPVTQAAIAATFSAIDRIISATNEHPDPSITTDLRKQPLSKTPGVHGISVHLRSNPAYKTLSVTQQKPFLGERHIADHSSEQQTEISTSEQNQQKPFPERSEHLTHNLAVLPNCSEVPIFTCEQRVAFVYFEFYNGAMSTSQCSRLIEALQYVASIESLEAVVLMGGNSYFSNGIALNVIEASCDPSTESWRNINRIDDVVHTLLEVFPQKNVTTIAAMRGNCAAGGVALATACDVVIASSESVLNPAYRALGLYGSEYHSLSYNGRCGPEIARGILRGMLPISAHRAKEIGLIDHVLPGSGPSLDTRVRDFVESLSCVPYKPGNWKSRVDVTPSGLATARAHELGEMAKDFWSARSERYTSRRRDFVRKIKSTKTPLRFATHRRREGEVDEEESDAFDDVANYGAMALDKITEHSSQGQKASFTKRNEEAKSHNEGVVIISELLRETRSAHDGKAMLFPCYYGVDTPVCT
ncbi:Hydrogenase maturation factor HoxX [Fusarium culmorum]|uniref:Hydrogenase maturation factor HoxX n=1 Tax=Fusarium culmorum TaxID=5516 RepID=A0A2T4GWS2_FUSCU|nr:Hydrogenase maturation factor HoxX [Fusarium culmorum]